MGIEGRHIHINMFSYHFLHIHTDPYLQSWFFWHRDWTQGSRRQDHSPRKYLKGKFCSVMKPRLNDNCRQQEVCGVCRTGAIGSFGGVCSGYLKKSDSPAKSTSLPRSGHAEPCPLFLLPVPCRSEFLRTSCSLLECHWILEILNSSAKVTRHGETILRPHSIVTTL